MVGAVKPSNATVSGRHGRIGQQHPPSASLATGFPLPACLSLLPCNLPCTYQTCKVGASRSTATAVEFYLCVAMLDQPDLGSMVRFVMKIKTSPPCSEEELSFCLAERQNPASNPNMCCGASPRPPHFCSHPRAIKRGGQLAKELPERSNHCPSLRGTHRDPVVGNHSSLQTACNG